MATTQNPLNVNTANPLLVTQGGTGFATTTAYALICGGTTTTGTLQHVSTLGTTGQILTSNGASALPTWQSGSGSITFTGDSGTPFTTASVTIMANVSAQDAGSTVAFNASTPNMTLQLSDALGNTMLGQFAGDNTAAGQFNVALGYSAFRGAPSGSYNVGLGNSVGMTYLTNESNNVLIGSNTAGVVGDNNVIRILDSTATTPATLCYIGGISGATPVSGNTPQVTLTDSAGNITVISSGTAGYVLTSNGSATPSFQVASGSAFTSIVVQTFTSSGTYTPTSGMAYCVIECFGAGGGGGGSGYSISDMNSGGGGSGGSGRLVASAATIGASKTVTIGTGGTGGTGGNGGTSTNPTNGSGGGTSSVGSLISCTGGSGGTGGTNISSPGGTSGTASGAGVIITLQEPGETGFNIQTSVGIGGAGGSSNFANGGVNTVTGSGATTTGNNGATGGGGGGGASGQISLGVSGNGGNGGNGYIVITEFIG